jgi:hypothetical protein
MSSRPPIIAFLITANAVVILAVAGVWLLTQTFDVTRPVPRGPVVVSASVPSVIMTDKGADPRGSLPVTADRTVRMLFFGDLMLDRHVAERMGAAGVVSLLEPLQASGIFAGYDLIGANLEGAVTDDGAHYRPDNAYDFAFAPANIAPLSDIGFNLFSSANNHLSDQGERGIAETAANLSALGFVHTGCSDRVVGDCSATTTVVNGKRIGFAAFSEVYGLLDDEAVLAVVRSLASSSDLTLVSIHWGVEYEHLPTRRQVEFGRKLAEAGADAVIGHHPHVVQGMTVHRGVPIFYSLGNFIFDQYFSPDTQEGLGVSFVFHPDRTELVFHPLKSKMSVVREMDELERRDFFKKFVEWSDLDDEQAVDITEGELIIENS